MSQPDWKIVRTTDWYLVRFDAGHIFLPIEFLSIGHRDVHKDKPIATHRKSDMAAVLPRPRFLRFAKHGAHPCVRHVRF